MVLASLQLSNNIKSGEGGGGGLRTELTLLCFKYLRLVKFSFLSIMIYRELMKY